MSFPIENNIYLTNKDMYFVAYDGVSEKRFKKDDIFLNLHVVLIRQDFRSNPILYKDQFVPKDHISCP